jgi:hypothetical protein
MNKVNQHIEDVLGEIRVIFQSAAEKIESLKENEKIPATKLAEELAVSCGMKGPQLYPTLKFLLNKYPNVIITRGAHGGITKINK